MTDRQVIKQLTYKDKEQKKENYHNAEGEDKNINCWEKIYIF